MKFIRHVSLNTRYTNIYSSSFLTKLSVTYYICIYLELFLPAYFVFVYGKSCYRNYLKLIRLQHIYVLRFAFLLFCLFFVFGLVSTVAPGPYSFVTCCCKLFLSRFLAVYVIVESVVNFVEGDAMGDGVGTKRLDDAVSVVMLRSS